MIHQIGCTLKHIKLTHHFTHLNHLQNPTKTIFVLTSISPSQSLSPSFYLNTSNPSFISQFPPPFSFPLPPHTSASPLIPNLPLSSSSSSPSSLIQSIIPTKPNTPSFKMDHPPRFLIEADEVESMAKESGVSVLQLLPSLVKSTQTLARPPISKFHVGAVGLGSDGRILSGVNLEFPGLPLNQSVHAEQFLITNAFINKESQIQFIAVSHAPCGHCRQFLQEIRGATDIKIFITSLKSDIVEDIDAHFTPISEFLPHRFGPDELLEKNVPLLLEPHDNGLVLSECNNVGSDTNGYADSCDEKLKFSALEAANESHAPYSGCPSGIAIMDSNGNVYKGSYMESAAYNPSLGPVQAALIAYITCGGGSYEEIVAAALVEKEGPIVGQEATARMLLKSVSPQCDLSVFHCQSSKKSCCKLS